MRFSERYGYKKVRELVQIESVDEPLLNALWSLLKLHVWDYAKYTYVDFGISGYFLSDKDNSELRILCTRLWFNYFKKPLDKLDDDWEKVLVYLRRYFFQCEWYEVYDFIEFVSNNYGRNSFKDEFI